jgi:hypothetical protein
MVEEKWTVREVENKTRAYKLREAKANKPKAVVKKDVHLEAVQDQIRSKVQAPTVVTGKTITIKYRDVDHLNKILIRMGVIED